MQFEGFGIPTNNELGWAWLNVALEHKIPEWIFAYQKISSVISEEIKDKWAPTVEQYIANYGPDGTYEFAQWHAIQELFFNP